MYGGKIVDATIKAITQRDKLRRMRIKFGLVGVLLVVAVATLFYLRNWQAAVFVALVLAYVIFRYYRPRRASRLS
jgi:Ca2+/Na+ antiporter